MPKATVEEMGSSPLPCPNCGRCPHNSLRVVAESKAVALEACERCWPECLRRGQLEAVKVMCREADKRAAGRPLQPDLSALR